MNTNTTLVIMAAGIGSRFGGGIKQLAAVGPNGEIIMDYSIHDAIEAGFDKIVFIIRHDIEDAFKEAIGDRIEKICAGLGVEIDYAFQALENVPEGFSVPEGRSKPWGTGQAVLACKGIIKEPFAVINADDYYGVSAFSTIYEKLQTLAPEGEATMVGYQLQNTVSKNGTVSRGVCAVEDGKLRSVREALKIQLYPDGTLRDLAEDTDLSPETVVSMNFWGFMPSIFDFLRALPPEEIKAECLLPTSVDKMMKAGMIDVRVYPTNSSWFGVTYTEDKPWVQASLRALTEAGVYPAHLWAD